MMYKKREISIIGAAFGIAAGNIGCGEGPLYCKEFFSHSEVLNFPYGWNDIIFNTGPFKPGRDIYDEVENLSLQLAYLSEKHIRKNGPLINIGGDHSCAIGMWSGVTAAMANQGELGLIWIDAHMDAHTPESSESGNIHGMPVASLLGFGDERFTKIGGPCPKIKPENMFLIGIRSYEDAERALLDKLGVKIYYIDEVNQRGFSIVLNEAVEGLSRNTSAFGISLDMDGIEPQDAPGVGTPVNNGIYAVELLQGLGRLDSNKLIAFECVEYNPYLDVNDKTAYLIAKILESVGPSLLQFNSNKHVNFYDAIGAREINETINY